MSTPEDVNIVNSLTLTIAAGATTIAKAEDVASADADVGVACLAVRKATPANTSGNDGDYEFLQMSAGRMWTSASLDEVTYIDDTSTHSTGTTKGVGIMAVATPTDGSVNANDIGMIGMTNDRRMYVDAVTGISRTYKIYSGTITSDTDIIAAVSTKKLKVFAYSITVTDNTADTIIFKSNGTSGTELWRVYLRGPDANTPYGANLAVSPGLDGAHLFETVAGEKLTADVSSGATLHLSVSYWDNDAT